MKKVLLVSGFLLSIIAVSEKSRVSAAEPILSTPLGRIRGVVSMAENGRSFNAFLGIPYARPPLGDLRFTPPVTPYRWYGVLNATRDGPICSQRDFLGDPSLLLGSEDCLYLNIYTPKLPSEHGHYALPVMIWIHGGSWLWWSGTSRHFNPARLMNKDLILITINYRLGWLGFLSTEDAVVPGNNGLKDQAAAIKWVSENIGAFGGDPQRITVAGQDTGAVSAHLHMFSPLTKDLITSVISHSGSAFAPSALSYPGEALRKTKSLAEANACPTESNPEMIACLRKLDVEQITTTDAILYVWNGQPSVPLRAVVEGTVEGAFLVEHPESTVEKGNQANISMMVGTVRDEGAVITSPLMFGTTTLSAIADNFRAAFPAIFVYEEYYSERAKNDISDAIKSHYFGDGRISATSVSDLQKAATTRLFSRPVNWIAEKQRVNNTIYLYQMNYRGSLSFSKIYGAGILDMGVCHGDDLLYLFDFHSLFRRSIGSTEEERVMKETISELWYNFVATGKPTLEITELLPNKWEPVDKNTQDLNTFVIDGPQNFMVMQRVQNAANRLDSSFWEGLSIAHNPNKDVFPQVTKTSWTNYIKNAFAKLKRGVKRLFGQS
ncbi:esterase E4-like isoform X1 [Neodiprion fabricii]|uniref:esterase E4-like isoform X1 n=1 Tax=Neodiprion fabricii TaxID=2872261 RepID=UPI001ED95429|nr:esterase E4-like isoform X1 [Neodiprion fabricii]